MSGCVPHPSPFFKHTMYRTLMLPALVALALTACKPTPRTANTKPRPAQQEQAADQQQATLAEAPQPATPPAPATPTPAPQAEASASLLTVSATNQDFNRLRPWDKGAAMRSEAMGVYLGEGKVLTYGQVARAATYLEIGLPDGSRRVPARVLRYDRDLSLALVTPVHEQDAAIFDSRRALEVGTPLKLGDNAAFHGLVRGLIPMSIPVVAESGDTEDVDLELTMPRLTLRTAQPLPEGGSYGLPIVREGKLVGLTAGYNAQRQSLTCINGELLARFLAGADGEYASSPMLGISYTGLDDPVFRRYLRLGDAQGGIYIKSVDAGGAAEQAGVLEGDVITAIDNLEIDIQGRCNHPLYGPLPVAALLRSAKPVGETFTLSISRDGQKQEIVVPLNRDAYEKALDGGIVPPGEQPRYVMWGGLLFQPMTCDFLRELMSRAKGSLPLEFLQLAEREEELVEKGVTEIVMLTTVIPTPATLSYDSVRFCAVEGVNGKPVHDFAEFVRLLDEPTPDGLVALSINKAPYTIYMDRRMAEAANSMLRRSSVPQLRNLGREAEPPATATTPPEAE